jgi:2-polyprenyl-3-methyl-5-hydroxy-6-metoxy-1,4-benzoquinol methylase
MIYRGVSTLETLTEAKNYNRWLVENFLVYLETPLLEFGSGLGNISALIRSYTPLCLTDADAKLLAHLRDTYAQSDGISVEYFDITQPPPMHLVEGFQSVIGLNVLEHIEDDEKTLLHLGQVLKPSGRLLLLVPAKRWAYTGLDKELGHFRRYEKNELREKLVNASFRIEKLYFFNIVGLMGWFFSQRIRPSGDLRPSQVALFDAMVPVLKRIEAIIPPPVGISLIAIAQKI